LKLYTNTASYTAILYQSWQWDPWHFFYDNVT